MLGAGRILGFHKFREVCQSLNCGEHATEFWQGLDTTLAGSISLFDLDPEAVALLIKLRTRLLALAHVSPDMEVDLDADSLFARFSFLVTPKKVGHLEPQEFRVVAKPLGITVEEANQAFTLLDHMGGYHHAPPATITAQDIAWLVKMPIRYRGKGRVDGMVDVQAVKMSSMSEVVSAEAMKSLTSSRRLGSARRSARGAGEILRFHLQDGSTPSSPSFMSQSPGGSISSMSSASPVKMSPKAEAWSSPAKGSLSRVSEDSFDDACRSCGAMFADNSRFCKKCGCKRGDEAPAAPSGHQQAHHHNKASPARSSSTTIDFDNQRITEQHAKHEKHEKHAAHHKPHAAPEAAHHHKQHAAQAEAHDAEEEEAEDEEDEAHEEYEEEEEGEEEEEVEEEEEHHGDQEEDADALEYY